MVSFRIGVLLHLTHDVIDLARFDDDGGFLFYVAFRRIIVEFEILASVFVFPVTSNRKRSMAEGCSDGLTTWVRIPKLPKCKKRNKLSQPEKRNSFKMKAKPVVVMFVP